MRGRFTPPSPCDDGDGTGADDDDDDDDDDATSLNTDAVERAVSEQGIGVIPSEFKQAWMDDVQDALAEATLQQPPDAGLPCDGKNGRHSEHLSYLLTEMQSVARAHPEGVW